MNFNIPEFFLNFNIPDFPVKMRSTILTIKSTSKNQENCRKLESPVLKIDNCLENREDRFL